MRPGHIWGTLAVVVAIAGAVYLYLADRSQDAAESQKAGAETIAVAEPAIEEVAIEDTAVAEAVPASDGLEQGAEATQQVALSNATESDDVLLETAPDPAAPTFDIVRVDSNGEAVIAGRAPSGSKVIVHDNGKPLGSVGSQATGTWVLIPEGKLAQGSHELSILAILSDGRKLWSNESALVVIPVALAKASETTASNSEPTIADELLSDEIGAAAALLDEPPLETASGGDSGALVVLLPKSEGETSVVLQVPSASAGEGLGEGTLILESIDYEADGRSVIAGWAPPGSQIQLYLDDVWIASATAGADGRWIVRPVSLIAPGLHRLRVDQVDASGAVMARVETPFSRADEAEAERLAEAGSVVVQPGNSLWRIARRVYGEGVRFTVIFQANSGQIRDPDLIYPGQIFTLPPEEG